MYTTGLALLLGFGLGAGLCAAARGDSITVTLPAAKDATLTQAAEPLGSGTSDGFYAGRVGQNGGGLRRRGLIAFDIAGAVPPGATVTSVTLTLQMVQSVAGVTPVSLHRVTAEWSEGPSSSSGGQGVPAVRGDATWQHRDFPALLWAVQGGDFVESASATVPVDATGPWTWSGPGMVADVQGWLDQPEGNFGWLVRGKETAVGTVKKFASRESLSPEFWPVLSVTYVPCAAADLNCDGSVGAKDLATLLSSWGGKGLGDLDGDGIVGAADLTILLGAWTAP
jgi:hypothetical protein